MKINYFICHDLKKALSLYHNMSIPSVMVPDPYQASVVDTAYAHKVAQPPIRSEWRTFIAAGSNGTPSGNQSIFNIFPPSNTTIVDKRMILRLTVTVTNVDIDAENVYHVPRAFPVNNAVNQVNVVINGSGGFVSQNNDLMYPLKRYIKDSEKTYYNSPTMLDPAGELTSVAIDPAGTDKDLGIASPFYGILSATTGTTIDLTTGLSLRANNQVGQGRDRISRAMFPPTGWKAGVTTTNPSSRSYVFSEVLMNGVLGDAGREVAFTNISKLDITVLYEAALDKLMFSSYQTTRLATVKIDKAELLCHFITPSITTLPSVFTTNFKQYVLNSQPVKYEQGATAGKVALTGSTFLNLTLNTVPEFFYIYIKPQKSVLTGATGQVFGEWTSRITNVSINLGTSFGHLSQMDEHTLFLMSRDNGYAAGGFEHWQEMGAVLCIDAAKDLGLVPGQNRYLPIDFTISSSTPVSIGVNSTLVAEICLLSVIPGTVNIAPDQCTSFLGFTAQDQGNAMNDDKVTQTVMVPETESGKGFNSHGGKLNWSGVWKGIKQGVKYVAPVLGQIAGATGNPMLGKIAGAADMANNALNQGAGYKRRRITGSGLLLG